MEVSMFKDSLVKLMIILTKLQTLIPIVYLHFDNVSDFAATFIGLLASL